jgi:hypothetical protein
VIAGVRDSLLALGDRQNSPNALALGKLRDFCAEPNQRLANLLGTELNF